MQRQTGEDSVVRKQPRPQPLERLDMGVALQSIGACPLPRSLSDNRTALVGRLPFRRLPDRHQPDSFLTEAYSVGVGGICFFISARF